MTASEYVKSKGFSTLQSVADRLCVSVTTLRGWHSTKPIVFETLIDGLLWQELKESMR